MTSFEECVDSVTLGNPRRPCSESVGKPMKLPQMVAVLFSLLVVSSAQQTGVGASKIVSRLVNGKNGKAIRNEAPNINLGGADPILPRTDSKGEITVDISNVQPFEARVRPNYYFDCHFKRDQMGPGGLQVSYSR